MGWSTRFHLYQDSDSSALTVITGESGQPPPAVGNGWLHLHHDAIDAFRSQVLFPTAWPTDILQGWLQAIVHIHSGGLNAFSLMCLVSQEDMRVSGGGTGYAVTAYTDPGPAYKLRLEKMTNGMEGVPLAVASGPTWTTDVTFTLQLGWDAAPTTIAELGGPVLNVAIGTALDFSDVVPVADLTNIIDLVSPYTSTVGSCLGSWHPNGGTGAQNVYIDQLTLIAP